MESKIPHKWTYLQNRNGLTYKENRLVVAKAEGGGNRVDQEFGVSRCKLLHWEWMGNEVLLYSTGNCVQSLGTEYYWGWYEKRNVHIRMTGSLCVQKSIDYWDLKFFFFLFRSIPAACGSSQVRGSKQSYGCWPMPQPQQHRIWATSTTYSTAHGKARSLTHWARLGIESASSWILVGFVNCWVTKGTPRREQKFLGHHTCTSRRLVVEDGQRPKSACSPIPTLDMDG